MTKSTITIERLEKIKSWRETYGAGSNVMLPAEEAEALALIALAAMDSEPVALKPELAKVIYHFRDWNEGFPVERFKADYVISWMLANYPPAQPAPLVPDGYVMVPKEMTDEIGEAIAMQANCCGGIALDIYDAMIAAAPHDTPALNSLQSVDSVTGGWIPVSERMPEAEGHYLVWANASRIDGYCDHLAIATYQGGEWSNEFNWLVTHWMPLPAAPQEVK
ncbi:Eaa1 [Klebsiella pneumoniae]|uniref:DUF551 domain-containing protein n=1 Tax=Klebsiella pneumoniae TaxID=573 RepID=UPI000DFF41F5|nr:DUF551 domain-containing protein [Klebsiella pneumoniae]STV99126.1 Eaa1 [Klebsiella pneumoniae]SXC46544.1 Eaa1 [Klebsiella pneumoniae]HBV2628505.1 DUF551 domain-containing protein [Klebsiella pneumoniae]HCD4421694.1 DUF551 domain-containing protein [Klebsiella pneumoniae]